MTTITTHLALHHLSDMAGTKSQEYILMLSTFFFLILKFWLFLPQFLHTINTDMLAANQVMIGKCFKLKYSWKRSSVQVQSKRNFLNVPPNWGKKITKSFFSHVYTRINYSNIVIMEMGSAGVDLSHLLLYILPNTSKKLWNSL